MEQGIPVNYLDDSAKMSYYKIVPKSDYTKMKDCHSAAYQNITKALEQDEDKQSKLLRRGYMAFTIAVS